MAEEVRELRYQTTLNRNLLLQLTNGTHLDMALPEDVLLPLKDRLMLEDLEQRLAQDADLQEKLVSTKIYGIVLTTYSKLKHLSMIGHGEQLS